MAFQDRHSPGFFDYLCREMVFVSPVEDIRFASLHLDIRAAILSRRDHGHCLVSQLDRGIGRDDLKDLRIVVSLVHDENLPFDKEKIRDLARGAQAFGHDGLDLQLRIPVKPDDRSRVQLDLTPPDCRRADSIPGKERKIQDCDLRSLLSLANHNRILAVVLDLCVGDSTEIDIILGRMNVCVMGPGMESLRNHQHQGKCKNIYDAFSVHGFTPFIFLFSSLLEQTSCQIIPQGRKALSARRLSS